MDTVDHAYHLMVRMLTRYSNPRVAADMAWDHAWDYAEGTLERKLWTAVSHIITSLFRL